MAGLMDIGKSGLQSYREALSVTGQNIANINTDGYKRREASLAEVTGSLGGINAIPSQAGLGVRVEEVRRSFDEFLLNKARNATSYAASADSYVNAVAQLEDIILPGDANIGSAIGRFMETLQEVAANPSDIAPRIVTMKSGETLASMFHQTAGLIEELQAGVFTQSEQAMTEINLLSKSLAGINRNIASSAGRAQNALLDNRDAIIDRISEYAEVTVKLENTGSATIRLGGSGNGPRLVDGEKAYTLSAVQNVDDMQFFLAEGADLKRTSQVTKGRLRGLADAFKSASDAVRSINHLAYKFINDINSIHMQGFDLEGQAGINMFHGIAFESVPSLTNLGNGSGIVDILDTDQISNDPIRFSYDADQSLWRAYDQYGANIASGKHQISLPGLNIEFSGDPVGGDEMLLQPAEGAAKNITFALTRPEQIASASGFLVSPDIGNTSDAQIDITASNEDIPPSSLPSIQDVLSNTHSTINSSQFRRDGAIAIIPANTDNIDLISMIQQSSIQFSIADAAVTEITDLSLKIDDGVNAEKTYTFDLSSYSETLNSHSTLSETDKFFWTDASKIAHLMNVGALKATNTVDVDVDGNPTEFTMNDLGGFVSGNNGNLNISLNTNEISSGTVIIDNYPDVMGITSARIDSASEIQIFTRNGRHVAGSSYSEVSSLVTEDNGFYAEALYNADYLNLSSDSGYMGMTVTTQSDYASDQISITDTDTGHLITFDRNNDIDGKESSTDGLKSSAAIFNYKLNIDDISFTLDESNVDGDTPAAIAKAALEEIRSTSPIASLTGISSLIESETIVLTNAQKSTLDSNGQLTLTYADVDYYLTYEDSTYAIAGGPKDQLSLSFDDNTKTITYTYPDLPDDGSSLVLSFEDQEYTLTMNDGNIDVTGGEDGRLIVSYDDTYTLKISSNNGSISASEITIIDDSVVSNNSTMALIFGLINTNSTPTTSFSYNSATYDPTTIGNVYTAPNYDLRISENTLILEKDEDHLNDSISITSSVTSKAESRIQITDLPDEEFIIFLTGSDDGNGERARSISAVYDQYTADMVLPKRDISITVTDAENGIIEFIDTATRTSMATRSLNANGKASNGDYNINISGVIADNDTFYLTNSHDGIHDNRNLLDLIALQNGTTNKGGFQKIFSGLIAEIGADIQASRLNAEAANTLKDASLEAEAMYSGVNLDTEASKLIELQQAYQASARILQTARELFDTLLQTI
jgi:flagellar hook-associated protein 1 FlgK